VILVDEAAANVVTMDAIGGRDGRNSLTRGYLEIDAAVRPSAVVMADVLSKDSLEVVMAEDEHPIEAFGPDGSHPALRVGVGSRRTNRGLSHTDAFGKEHLVEAGRELGVPIADQELDGASPISQIAKEVAGHLGDPRTDWMFGDVWVPGMPSGLRTLGLWRAPA
jgi:hypothetical protein